MDERGGEQGRSGGRDGHQQPADRGGEASAAGAEPARRRVDHGADAEDGGAGAERAPAGRALEAHLDGGQHPGDHERRARALDHPRGHQRRAGGGEAAGRGGGGEGGGPDEVGPAAAPDLAEVGPGDQQDGELRQDTDTGTTVSMCVAAAQGAETGAGER
ncbi:hypothetical protein [Actinosynnema mirum]|uniref:hypothetical protein n=1 Tax=Actinosynnema mirum TaxID=40567 RepID=UPI00019ABF73|nr:hypothetical protein [Actinosynnema mirum]